MLLSDDILREYAAKAVPTAATNLRARPAPAGTMTRGARPGWARVLLHEAIATASKAISTRKGS